jgi:hypothetical protein
VLDPMEKEGLKQLRRVFGDVIREGELSYMIDFPKAASWSRNEDDDAGGGLLDAEDTQPHEVKPNIEAYFELKSLGKIPHGEMVHYEVHDCAVVEITKYSAERKPFIEALKKLEDGHFCYLTQADEREVQGKTLVQRMLARLNSLHKDTRWHIAEGLTGEIVYSTTMPVANAQGVLYLITEALGVPIASITMPPKGAGSPALPISLVTEDNIGKMEKLNPMKLQELLKPSGQRHVG